MSWKVAALLFILSLQNSFFVGGSFTAVTEICRLHMLILKAE